MPNKENGKALFFYSRYNIKNNEKYFPTAPVRRWTLVNCLINHWNLSWKKMQEKFSIINIFRSDTCVLNCSLVLGLIMYSHRAWKYAIHTLLLFINLDWTSEPSNHLAYWSFLHISSYSAPNSRSLWSTNQTCLYV